MADPAALGLVGDVGGTNARFALASRTSDDEASVGEPRTWPTRDLHDLPGIWRALSGSDQPPAFACVAVAAPVSGPSVRLTNAAVTLDIHTLQSSRARLVNDLEAAAAGVRAVSAADRRLLVEGTRDPARPAVVVGLGTGLGVALCLPDGTVLGGEGGHAPFAPANAVLADFSEALSAARNRPTEWEDLLCGRGLGRVVAWYRDDRALALSADLPALEALAVNASQGPSPLVPEAAIEAWVGAVADVCRGVALTVRAGAVHICGGVAAHLSSALARPIFAQRFRAPGPVSHVLADVPVELVTDQMLALRGCLALIER